MNVDIDAALRQVVGDMGADAGVLVTVDDTGLVTATATTIGGRMRHGDQWPAGPTLLRTDDAPFVVTDPAEHVQVLPAAARLALRRTPTAVLVVPVPGRRSRVLFIWCDELHVGDLVARAHSTSVQLFLSLTPLLEAHVAAHDQAMQMHAVVGALQQAVVVIASTAATATVNAAAATLLRLDSLSPPTEVAAAALRDLRRRAHDPDGIESSIAGMIGSGDTVVRDMLWTFDEAPTHLRVHSAPVGPGGGRVWVFDDVSAEMDLLRREHATRMALEESERRFRMILENASDVVFQNVAGVLQWVSPNVEVMLGWQPEELVGRTTEHLWHPDDHPRAVLLRDSAYSGESNRDVLRISNRNGDHVWVEVALQPFVDSDGRPGSIGLMHDVTDRVLATAAAQRSEQQYRLLAEHASDVVFQQSADGIVMWVSPSVKDVLGLEPDEMVGTAVTALFHGEDAPAVLAASRRIGSGHRASYRARYRRADGDLRWCEVVVHPATGEGGEVVSSVGSLRDVHDQMVAELALGESENQARALAAQAAAARDDAERANLEKTTFLSRMSHELRTPLNAVIGYAQLLELDDLTDAQRTALRQIRSGGTHLLDLINEILDIARIEAGRVELNSEPVAVEDVLATALDMVATMARVCRVDVRAPDLADGGPMMYGDRKRLVQVVINLLTNAVKYNRPGGTVDVTCRAVDGQVAIEVRDSGRGISPDKLARVFDAFDRLGAEATDIEGTGIGLTLSQALAGAMGGRIDVTSVVDEGSVFTLVVPVATEDGTAAAATAAEPQAQPGTDGAHGPRRVIYVEDNEQNATLMRRLLATRGDVDLHVARTAADGLAAVAERPADLVFLDLHLPDAPGTEVLRDIRAMEGLSDLPVVVLTADASPGLRRTMLELGATAFVTKPFDIRDVLAWVDRVPSRD